MDNGTVRDLVRKAGSVSDVLTELLRDGAERMLAAAIEDEVEAYIREHVHERDAMGKRLVVRNGSMPERQLETSIGSLRIRQPRVNDRRINESGERIRFSSTLVPPYLRRAKSVDDLVPWLYLRGISTSDFTEFLQKLTGSEEASLSPATVVRLKETWQQEHEAWSKRSLAGKRYVYFWVDGIHANVRLQDERQCLLVIIGATESGEKELVAVFDGVRESEQSWREVLIDLKSRGLESEPKLVIGDGALGFWAALPKVFSWTCAQRCWFHKSGNVLNYLPKGTQPQAKRDIQAIWMAETRAQAEKAFDLFVSKYSAKYPKAVDCLVKDRKNDEPNRVDVRDDSTPTSSNEGIGLTPRELDDDVQTRADRRVALEEAQRNRTPARCDSRSSIQGWHQGRRCLMQNSDPQLLTISPSPSVTRHRF